MASNINPGNINQDYPVSGQDNDSQGFRDNFTNIRTNFTDTKTEIEDLQSKVVLKSALTGSQTFDNNMDGAIIKSAVLQDSRKLVIINANAQSSTEIDVKAGYYYKLTSTYNIDLSFINWPPAGQTTEVIVEVIITEITPDVLATVQIPAAADASASGMSGYFNNTFHFPAEGTYIFEFSSTDGGASIKVLERSVKPQRFYRQTITAIGLDGDKQGMIAFNDTTTYKCIADWVTPGDLSIWVEINAAPVSDVTKVDIAGDTMTGDLILAADPTVALGAATKDYVDTEVANIPANADKVDIAGDTMTGFLTLNADPTTALHAATKDYVDTEVAGAGGGLTTYNATFTEQAVSNRTTYVIPDDADVINIYKPGNNGFNAREAIFTLPAMTDRSAKYYIDINFSMSYQDDSYKNFNIYFDVANLSGDDVWWDGITNGASSITIGYLDKSNLVLRVVGNPIDDIWRVIKVSEGIPYMAA